MNKLYHSRCALAFVFAVLVVVTQPGYCQDPTTGSRSAREMSFTLPADIHADAVTLLVGAYGPGLNLARVRTEEGKYKYTHALPDSATSVKILAHYPGTKIVTAEFAIGDPVLSQPFSPVFEPLPMVPATLKLVDTNGKPLAGLKVSLNQQLGTMEFFSFSDGMVWSGPVAAGKVRRERDFVIYYESADVFTTDVRGEFKLQLPSLQDDPYFKRVGIEEPSFGINVPSRADEEDGFGWYPTPSSIPAQKKYEKPVTVTMTYYGKVDVSISEALLDELDVPAEARKSLTIMLARPDGSGTGRTLDPDGSGMVKWVSPGTYEIRLEVPPVGPDGKSRSIWLEGQVVVAEREVLILKR